MAISLKSLMFGGLLAAGLLATAAVTAQAETYKFYSGVTPGDAAYTGAYSGAGTVYAATQGAATDCPIEDNCTGDYLAPSMSFAGSDGPVTATSTGSSATQVWDDLSPLYAGLGVDTIADVDPGDDQIDGAEVLTLTFASPVKLLGVATLFADGHVPFGTGFPTAASIVAAQGVISFLLDVDGGGFASVLFKTANDIGLSLTGTVFSFMQQIDCGAYSRCKYQPSFYVSALITGPADVPGEVPIPAALPLLLAGLGVLGLVRRRKQKA